MKTNCVKCDYESEDNKQKFNENLCGICHHFSPDDKERFKEFIDDKLDGRVLESYRKHQGRIASAPPKFLYNGGIKNGEGVPDGVAKH